MDIAALYIYAYLIGSIPTAYIIGRTVRGIDIREYGSGNVGAANVFSSVGRVWVIPLALFEVFVKGSSPVWIGMLFLDMDTSSPALMGAALVAIAGNNWSCYLKFTGGRGMTVAVGALFAIAYRELIVFAGIALAGWIIFRSAGVWIYISLILLPLWTIIFDQPLAVTWFCAGLTAVVTLKRLTANWEPLPEELPKLHVYFNRLFRDRDYASRDQWLNRAPNQENKPPS